MSKYLNQQISVSSIINVIDLKADNIELFNENEDQAYNPNRLIQRLEQLNVGKKDNSGYSGYSTEIENGNTDYSNRKDLDLIIDELWIELNQPFVIDESNYPIYPYEEF